MKTTDLSTATVLVTGANRGLGKHLAEQLVARGAKVYAGARRAESVDIPGAIAVQLDITDPASVAAAVQAAPDVTVLINNAGIATGGSVLAGDLAAIRNDFATNVFGTLDTVRAFAPILESNGGGAVLNVLSVLSWFSLPDLAGYSASKSAEWSLTNALRAELAGRGVAVTALHVGYMDTDLAAHVDGPKSDPAAVAEQALDALAAGEPEILADELSVQVRGGLAGGVAALYPDVA